MNAPQRVEFAEPVIDQLNPLAGHKPGDIVHMPERPLTVIEQAIKTGATAEQLERILDLQVRADNHKLDLMREQRRMAEEDRKAAAMLAFRRDFAAFRGENIIIPKSKFVDRGKAGSFHQAEYGAVMQMLSPALSKHGFSLRHNEVFGAKKWTTDGVENDVPWVYVTCYLEHRDGHTESLDLEGPPGELSANTPVQNMQATGSYLKRQSTLAITGTATADEDDESKLARKSAARADQPRADDAPLLQAGRDASMNGLKALTAWWQGLTAEQRERLMPEFGAMRQAARTADESSKGEGRAMIVLNHPQGSEDWLRARVGVCTASRFTDARGKLTKASKNGNAGDPNGDAIKYSWLLAVEAIAREPLDETFVTYAMRRGRDLEPQAREVYEIRTGAVVEEVSLILTDDERFGYSADGFRDDDGLIEIKCPMACDKLGAVWASPETAHLEYIDQINGGLWITGRKYCDLIVYCPWLAPVGKDLFVKRIYRDDNAIEALEADLVGFMRLVDANLSVLRNPTKMSGAPKDAAPAAPTTAPAPADLDAPPWEEPKAPAPAPAAATATTKAPAKPVVAAF